MLSEQEFLAVVSGQSRGLRAMALRGLLRIAEAPYTGVVQWRNRQFNRGRNVHRVEVPVISVGNLTVGGTGKTPMVKWIARQLRAQQVRVALLSRGYRAGEGGYNDEALELEQSLPDVPHLQDPDRVASAQIAIEELEAQLLLLDDGFQHRRIARDLDLVLLDATNPFGFEHVFPRGLLREPVSNLSRAHAVCLTRASHLDSEARKQLRQRVKKLAPQASWSEAMHRPEGLINAAGESSPLTEVAGQKVLGFCGIGNAEAFKRSLLELGVELVGWHPFGDHHRYQAADIRQLCQLAEATQAEQILCTQKDLVKVQQEELAGLPLRAVAIEMHFLAGQQALADLISDIANQIPQAIESL